MQEIYTAAEARALFSGSSKKPKKKRLQSNNTQSADVFPKFVHDQTGLTVTKELEFHPSRKWRFDYAIPEIMLAIEVEGGVFKKRTYTNKRGETITTTGGRHNSASGFLGDMEKYNAAALAGWKVYRVTPAKLMTSEVLNVINSLKAKKCE